MLFITFLTKIGTFLAGRPRRAPMPRSAYADGSQRSESPKSFKIHAVFNKARCSAKTREAPKAKHAPPALHYGESDDPWKMTYSRMAVSSRPCSSFSSQKNAYHKQRPLRLWFDSDLPKLARSTRSRRSPDDAPRDGQRPSALVRVSNAFAQEVCCAREAYNSISQHTHTQQ